MEVLIRITILILRIILMAIPDTLVLTIIITKTTCSYEPVVFLVLLHNQALFFISTLPVDLPSDTSF